MFWYYIFHIYRYSYSNAKSYICKCRVNLFKWIRCWCYFNDVYLICTSSIYQTIKQIKIDYIASWNKCLWKLAVKKQKTINNFKITVPLLKTTIMWKSLSCHHFFICRMPEYKNFNIRQFFKHYNFFIAKRENFLMEFVSSFTDMFNKVISF